MKSKKNALEESVDSNIPKLKAVITMEYPAYPAWYPEEASPMECANCDATLFQRRPEEFLKIWKGITKSGEGTININVFPGDK